MESSYYEKSSEDFNLLRCKAGHAGEDDSPVKLMVSVLFYHALVFRDMLRVFTLQGQKESKDLNAGFHAVASRYQVMQAARSLVVNNHVSCQILNTFSTQTSHMLCKMFT